MRWTCLKAGLKARRWLALLSVVISIRLVPLHGQEGGQNQKPVIYVIATAHLDSQWNWTVQDTIRQFVPDSFHANFKYFEQFPHYTFTFEGPIHYMWFKEYYPEEWPAVQKYVAQGRWRLAGSWIDASDVNVPSPEALMRQALYGQRFYRQEFDKVSRDVYLPDCFGFGFALPSVAAHSGLTAFSTQKLTWGSAVPIPFPIGRWKGVDGNSVVAALKPGDYVTQIRSDISVDPQWSNDLTSLGDGRQVALRYFGTGDIGGAPPAGSVELLEKAMTNPNGKVEIRNTSPDQISRDLSPAEKAALPEYEGELLLKTHGVGCYTSQAAMKRFNRMNELLADSAERAAVAADWLAGLPYPGERLRSAWYRVLWHQFHDDLTGTSIPQAYMFSWNDELSAANQFAGVLVSSTNAVAGLLDTQVVGIPLIVYNPVAAARLDSVEATVQLRSSSAPAAIRLIDRVTGKDVPVQVLDRQGSQIHILFLADMPSIGFKVFEVRTEVPSQDAMAQLSVTPSSIENARYAVKIDVNGDLASVFDKETGKELLSGPVRLEMRSDPSPDKPAWRILYETVTAAPREYPLAPSVRVVERGPVRVALEISRKAAGSTFVQRVMLTNGGDRVDVENLIDWKSPNTLLKASFPFVASNPKATYDLGLGTIERGNNSPDRYEVPAQKWADLTDAGGTFGAAVLNDSKYGWDKPADNVLRLTLLHTPLPKAYPYQSSNDLGHHRFVYSIAGHRGDWRTGRVPARAAALNQPLVAFQATPHAGLGTSFSMLALNDPSGQVAVVALKKAEDEDEYVLRLQELYGRPANARINLAGEIVSASEVNAAEEPVGDYPSSGRVLTVDLKPYQPRTFALRLKRISAASPARAVTPLKLPFNLDGVSPDGDRADGDFDGSKHTLAAELLPQELELDGMQFLFGSSARGALNVLVPKGQKIALPPASYDRLYLLAAAVGRDVPTSIGVGPVNALVRRSINIREWEGPIGQWDSRLKDARMLRDAYIPAIDLKRQTWTTEAIQADMVVPWDPMTFAISGIEQIRPGFVKRDEIAWIGTHRHAPDGNQPYIMSYVFAYEIDLPPGTRDIVLPNDDRLRILAMTAAREPHRVTPATVLYAPELAEPHAAPSIAR